MKVSAQFKVGALECMVEIHGDTEQEVSAAMHELFPLIRSELGRPEKESATGEGDEHPLSRASRKICASLPVPKRPRAISESRGLFGVSAANKLQGNLCRRCAAHCAQRIEDAAQDGE